MNVIETTQKARKQNRRKEREGEKRRERRKNVAQTKRKPLNSIDGGVVKNGRRKESRKTSCWRLGITSSNDHFYCL